jgi:hypothetical protein
MWKERATLFVGVVDYSVTDFSKLATEDSPN